jgi:hypothetical protein
MRKVKFVYNHINILTTQTQKTHAEEEHEVHVQQMDTYFMHATR